MTAKTKRTAAFVCNILAALAGLIAIAVAFSYRGPYVLWYYTQDSNIFAALVSTAYAIIAIRCRVWSTTPKPLPKTLHKLRYYSVCCLCVTFLVVIFVLAPNPLSGGYTKMLFEDTNAALHTFCPIVSALSFIFLETDCCEYSESVLTRRHILFSLLPTLIYAAFLYPANILGFVRGPYPFFLVNEMPLWESILWFVGLMIGFTLISTGIYAAHKQCSKKAARKLVEHNGQQ